MKRFFLVIFISTLLTPVIAVGQFSKYGVKAGVLSAGAYSDPSTDGRVIGFGIYGFTDFELSNYFFSTIDFGITQRGFSNTELRTDETGVLIAEEEAKTRLFYATLAPSLNISLQSAKLPVFFGVAPRFELLLDKSLGTYGTSPAMDYTATSIDDFVLGFYISGGVKKLDVGRLDLRLEARYEVDVTDSLNDSPRTFRNNAVMIAFGILL